MKSRLYKLVLFSAFLLSISLIYVNAFAKTSNKWNSADKKHIDKTITDFMTKNGLSGSSVAIVKEGRLVFSKGYGFIDSTKSKAVDTNSLFRIASVSKPITSVAIMKLVEDKKLKLSERVFGKGGILGMQYGSKPYSNYEKAITIEQLLLHTAGGKTWDFNGNDGSSDPMFSKPKMNHSQLISWVLDNREPSTKPGTSYSYSNFGYVLLGRIIEKVTNQSYETYIKNSILKPMGITSMRIGGDKKSDRYPNEVFYEESSNYAYNMKVKRMDADGGWIASANDLVRFMVNVDGFSTKADFLNTTSIKKMIQGSKANKYYAKGWSVNKNNNWWHLGSLPGTSSILVRTSSGFSWAFLTNKRKSGKFMLELDQMMWNAVNGVKSWPKIDLF